MITDFIQSVMLEKKTKQNKKSIIIMDQNGFLNKSLIGFHIYLWYDYHR